MPQLQLLIKPSSSACNMVCRYCFYNDVAANRACGFRGMMSLDTLEVLVKQALTYSTGVCGFTFQGGEPTLVGLTFYRRLIEYQQRYNVNQVQIHNSIQTNGYGLDEEWAIFFKKHHFLVGVSIDGNAGSHNYNRKTKDGRSTLPAIMETIRLFDKHRVSYNILSVVTGRNAQRIRSNYAFFRKHQFQYLQFIPCLEPFGQGKGSADYHLPVAEYEKFLIDVFDLWYDDFMAGKMVSIRHIDNWLSIALGRPPEACNMCGRCSIQWVIEADGAVYPCDFYVLDEWQLGSIGQDSFETMFHSPAARRFLEESLPVPEACRQCRFAFLCRNGCKRERFDNGQGDSVYYYCQAIQGFFTKREKEFSQAVRLLKQRLA